MTTEYTSEELHRLHEAYFQELTAGDYLHKPLQFDEFLEAFVESSGTLAKAFFSDIKHSSFLAGVRDLRNNKITVYLIEKSGNFLERIPENVDVKEIKFLSGERNFCT